METMTKQVVPAALVLSSLAYLAMTFNNLTGAAQSVELQINSGKIIGMVRQSRLGRDYSDFRGIPYAEKPIGNLRFEPPKPIKPWKNSVLDTTQFGPMCMQYDFLTHVLTGGEDCLYLNVATPNSLTKPKELLPVIVFIYGGVFMSGYSNVYTGIYFMDEDVVLVTLNYRLGVFGFLNTGDEMVKGNMGLKDQNLALKWVRDNIMYFGGDPNKVTLMGQSAGGSSAHLHMMSPLSKGLFHRVISQSGNALNYFAFSKNPRAQAFRLGERMNCPPTNNSRELVTCLKNLPAITLNRENELYLDLIAGRNEFYRPSIEYVKDSNTFLHDHPQNLIKAGKVAKVPWIVGANVNEAVMFIIIILNSYDHADLNTHWKKYGPMLFSYEGHPNAENITQTLRDRFLGEAKFDWNSLKVGTSTLTDRLFNEGLYDSVRLQSNMSDIYAYQYTYKGDFSLAAIVKQMTGRVPKVFSLVYSLGRRFVAKALNWDVPDFEGISHLDEIPLFFHLPFLSQTIVPGTKDYPMSSAMVKLWCSFATNGKPDKFFDVEWRPVSKNASFDSKSIMYLKLDERPKMIPEPFTSSIEFWKSLKLDF